MNSLLRIVDAHVGIDVAVMDAQLSEFGGVPIEDSSAKTIAAYFGRPGLTTNALVMLGGGRATSPERLLSRIALENKILIECDCGRDHGNQRLALDALAGWVIAKGVEVPEVVPS